MNIIGGRNVMKISLSKIILIFTLLLLLGCTNENDPNNNKSSNESENNASTEVATEETDVETEEIEEEIEEPQEELITESELESLIDQQPLRVVDTNYLIQSSEHKTLYPDMLQAIIENNSGEDIRDAVIAFVAWDSNGLPLKLEASFDLSGGSYIYPVNARDINLPDGNRYGDESGFEVAEHLDIGEFKAIVVSYETFEDEEWINEYFDDFKRLYEGQKRK